MDERNPLAACELEAAEALASFAQDSHSIAFNRGFLEETVVDPFQAQRRTTQLFPNPITAASPQMVENISTNWSGRGGKRLTMAEQEERRRRRVLANRESARQTIIRRQALFQDLTKKAAELAEENERLKKTKKLALEQHGSLKHTNEHLKAKWSKVAPTAPAKSSSFTAKRSSSLSSNPPSVVPIYWPAIQPQPVQFLIPPNSTHHQQQQQVSVNPRAPLVFLPVPCLLPFVAFGCVPKEGSQHHGEASSSMAVCDPYQIMGNITVDVPATTEARWRRKELMKVRNNPH